MYMKNLIFELKEAELNEISAGDILDTVKNVGAGAFLGLPGIGPLATNGLINKCLEIMFNPVERVAKVTGNLANVQKLRGVLKNDVKIMTITSAVSGVLICGGVGVSAATLGYNYGRQKSKEE